MTSPLGKQGPPPNISMPSCPVLKYSRGGTQKSFSDLVSCPNKSLEAGDPHVVLDAQSHTLIGHIHCIFKYSTVSTPILGLPNKHGHRPFRVIANTSHRTICVTEKVALGNFLSNSDLEMEKNALIARMQKEVEAKIRSLAIFPLQQPISVGGCAIAT